VASNSLLSYVEFDVNIDTSKIRSAWCIEGIGRILKGRHYLEDHQVNVKIILKFILRKYCACFWLSVG
jgi:hypothetical protein